MHTMKRLKRLAPDSVVDMVDRLRAFPKVLGKAVPFSHPAVIPPFFIVGCGRSGNTLLRAQLVSQYAVCIPPEIPGLGNTIRCFARVNRRSWKEIVDAILAEFHRNADITRQYSANGVSYNLAIELGLDYSAISDVLLALPVASRSLSRIIIEIYADYAKREVPPGTALGDKTPWNAFHLGRISRTFPTARFIHMLRDPRATTASYVSNFNGIEKITVQAAAERWVDATARITRYARKNPGSVLTVRYESLVASSDSVVKEVAGFLGLSPAHADWKTMNFGDQDLPHYKQAFAPVVAGSVDRWRSVLSAEDSALVQRICRPAMDPYYGCD